MIIKILLAILLVGAFYTAYDMFFASPEDKGKLNLTLEQQQHYDSLMENQGFNAGKREEIKKQLFTKLEQEKDSPVKQDIKLLSLNEKIAIKVEKIYINSINNLMIDMKFGNKTSEKYNDKVKVECVAFLNNNELERFKWNQNILIEPKKAILIKSMDFGKVASKEIDDIKCRTLL